MGVDGTLVEGVDVEVRDVDTTGAVQEGVLHVVARAVDDGVDFYLSSVLQENRVLGEAY